MPASDAESLLAAAALRRDSVRMLETARAAEDAAALSDGAAEPLDEARETYRRCGAVRDLARAESAQRRLGVRRGVTGPRRRPATGWDALTDTS